MVVRQYEVVTSCSMCTRLVAKSVQEESSLWIVRPRGVSLLSLVKVHFYSLLIPTC